MMYVRGNKLDYDSWEKHGATGWNWDNVKKYFKRAENFFLDGGKISIQNLTLAVTGVKSSEQNLSHRTTST